MAFTKNTTLLCLIVNCGSLVLVYTVIKASSTVWCRSHFKLILILFFYFICVGMVNIFEGKSTNSYLVLNNNNIIIKFELSEIILHLAEGNVFKY